MSAPVRVVKLVIENLDDEIEIQEHYAYNTFSDWKTFIETVQEKYGSGVAERLLSLPPRQIAVFNVDGVKAFVFSNDTPITSSIKQYTEVICIDLLDHEQRSELEFEGREHTEKRTRSRYLWRYCYKHTYKHT